MTRCRRVYAAHDVLVFASTRNEGMPMVMMEAMCAGCAVPNTGSGGAIELSERAGTPAVSQRTIRSRSAVCCRRSRRIGLGVAEIALRGQQTVLREFTIHQMLEKTCAVFGRVAGARQTPELQTAT